MKIVRGDVHAPLDPLIDRTVAVIGYGNQGTAHALNLRDSGLRVIVGARPDGHGADAAASAGFETTSIDAAAAAADLIIVALPDEVQPDVYAAAIAPNVRPGSIVGFIHGFAIRYNLIAPADDIGVVMVAPKGPGRTLRQLFEHDRGLPCLFAVHQDTPAQDAEPVGLAWAAGIGSARSGIVYTTFAAETETDLFGEQAVLCGGLMGLITTAFETLVEAGYPPELAYLECCHEVKQVADLIYAGGVRGMCAHISNTAEFGAYRAAPALADDRVRARMRSLLADIQSGAFAEAMRADYAAGFDWYRQQQRAIAGHPLEQAGEAIRAMMPWLNEST